MNTPPYRIEEDGPFLPKDIFSEDLYCSGLVPVTTEATEETAATVSVKCVPGEGGVFVLPGEFGKCYEVKFTKEANVVAAMQASRDPRLLAEGETLEGVGMECDFDSQSSFMYVCRGEQEFLVICVSEKGAPVYIGERTILQKTDTAGDWFIPSASSLTDPDGTFGNYQWTAQQVMDNLYEPYRAQYPDYITRTHLGKDQTGQYDMYGYVYAPETYKATGLVKVSREGWAAILHEGVYCGNGRKGRYSFDTIEDADILWKNSKKRNRLFLSADFRPETLNYGILYDKIDQIKRNFAK